ncbi:hypothetical protein ACKFKG_25965 [Phormidesmis sp. 146-35]
MNTSPLVIDLGMSDIEYLDCLARGIDPVKAFRDKLYEQELREYGFAEAEAQAIAPLLEKSDCSISEKILVNRALKQIWKRLSRSV